MAVEKGDWKVTQEQACLLENALAKNTQLLRRAVAELKSGGIHKK